MYVCMYMYAICMHASMYVCVCVCMYICMNVCMRVYMQKNYINKCMRVYKRIYISYMNTCIIPYTHYTHTYRNAYFEISFLKLREILYRGISSVFYPTKNRGSETCDVL